MPEFSTILLTFFRAYLRMAIGLFLLLAGLLIVGIVFPLLQYRQRMWAVRCWSILFNKGFGLRIVHRGAVPPAAAALIVANHVSWLDIFVIDTWHPCRFVAKSEINHWPIIGWLCRHTGTLFISRQRRHDTGRIRHQMVHGLHRGHTLAVFPEGTTSDGRAVLPFNPSLLQAALDTQVPIYTVTLRYLNAAGELDATAAFIGEMTLWQSIRQIIQAKGLVAEVIVEEPLIDWASDRRALSEHCHHAISDRLAGTSQ